MSFFFFALIQTINPSAIKHVAGRYFHIYLRKILLRNSWNVEDVGRNPS